MRTMRPILLGGLVLMLTAALAGCASARKQPVKVPEKKPVPAQPLRADMTVDELLQEIREHVDERIREYEARGKQGRAGSGAAKRDERPRPSREEFVKQGLQLLQQLRERVHADLIARIERDFGVAAPPQTEFVPLEATDQDGNAVEVSVPVETRELRKLTLPANRARMHALVGDEDLTLALYAGVPSTIAPAESNGYMRAYTGEEADAIAMEAELIVTLKGGAWVEPDGTKPVANTVAVRGLDLDRGLQPNANTTYDDTMYVVVEQADAPVEVYEYRMTTESSSTDRGVGRLDNKQVTYVRGLHRGKDPGYRLKGGSAEGTRREMEGEYRITGANIHSAYSKRPITSDTPLKANVSLGCQVVATGKNPFEKSLVNLLDKKGVKQFPYTIVDEEEMAFLDQSLRENGKTSILVHAITRGA